VGDVAGTTLYFADVQTPFTFENHAYQPLLLRFDGLSQASQQQLPAVSVTAPNIDGQLGAWLEVHDVCGLIIILYLFHLDAIGQATEADRVRLSILAAEWDWLQATLHCGLDLGLSEVLPRTLYNALEEPGSPEGLRRASIL
jgi:hypothetical protein